jgi:hypothetical protein
MNKPVTEPAVALRVWIILGAAAGGGLAWLMVDIHFVDVGDSVSESIANHVGKFTAKGVLSIMAIGACLSVVTSASWRFLRLGQIRSWMAWSVGGAVLAIGITFALPIAAIFGEAVAGPVGTIIGGICAGIIAAISVLGVVAALGGRDAETGGFEYEQARSPGLLNRLLDKVCSGWPVKARLALGCILVPIGLAFCFYLKGVTIRSTAGGFLLVSLACWIIISVIGLLRMK